VAVFEEGDLQFVGVVPIGGNNITNDLAIGLKTNPEVAEQVKLKHARAVARETSEAVSVKHDKETLQFETADIDEIVEARLEEIFEGIEKELKKAGRSGKLPSGVVLVGDGSHLNKLSDFAKEALGLAVTIGRPTGFAGVNEKVEQPEFAAAVGLMLLDADMLTTGQVGHKKGTDSGLSGGLKASKGLLARIFKKFK
jgi:cell division protein FtsA